MLHCTKLLGEQNSNLFTNVEKISQQGALEHTMNPVFGLKRDLIRVLSNMAYRNRANQDMVCYTMQSILDNLGI